MMMKQVYEDIRMVMRHETAWPWRAHSSSGPLTSAIMCLQIDWREIRMDLLSGPPLREDLCIQLQQHLEQHPEMLNAADYPENIMVWIEENLLTWEQGDLLGVYLPRHKVIELYWLAIVLCARREKWNVSDLAEIVLIHECAHACTHLGADADGRTWNTDAFCRQTTGVLEGLAQYWTHYVLMGMVAKRDALLPVFLGLMKIQPAPYRSHMTWLEEKAQELYQKQGMSPVQSLETTVPFHAPICEHVRARCVALRSQRTALSVVEFTRSLDLTDVAMTQIAGIF